MRVHSSMWGHRYSSPILSLFILHVTLISLSKANPMGQRTTPQNSTVQSSDAARATSINIRLSDSETLRLLLAAYIAEHGQANATATSRQRAAITLHPALLDYENATAVDNLERTIGNSSEPDAVMDLPEDVYEVPLERWIHVDNTEVNNANEQEPIDETQRIILEALRPDSSSPSPDHSIRHRGRRVAGRRTNSDRNNRGVSEDSVSLPIDNIDMNPNILNLLRRQQDASDSGGSLDILRQRQRFNMTVDYQAPFENIPTRDLRDIIRLMRSDCTQLQRQKSQVRWVSGTRGILFECRNGAWVVKYLSRRKGKQRPSTITDCHEIHVQGLQLEHPQAPHQLIIHYNSGERKTKHIMCKHDDRHTDHQLIDNHINADPNPLVTPNRLTSSGAWTIIQRRESGNTKFYRSMKRYKRGFGDVESGEYWLGLETLHEITHARDYMLRVEITSGDNQTFYSEYDRFKIGSEAKSYRLRLGSFIEPANGTFSSGDYLTLHNGGRFHTRDSDKFSVNCARLYGTAFWFRGCWAAVNLNGPYILGDADNSGVRWATANPNEVRRVWKTEMMIKPIL